MANIDPAPSWANIRRLETTDRNMAGPGGILNDPTTSIAARLNLLRDNDTTLGNSIAAVNSRQDATDSAIATIQGQVLTAPGTLSDLENGAALDPAASFPDVPSVENSLGPVDAINSSIEKLTARSKQLRDWRNADLLRPASDVPYQAQLPGTVQSSVGTALSQWLTFEDFGAVGDGITDDTAAIQAAIAVAGRAIHILPNKTYLCGEVRPAPGTHLFAHATAGYTTDILTSRPRILMAAGARCLFDVYGVFGFSVTNVVLDGRDRSAPVITNGSDRLTLYNTRILNASVGVGGPKVVTESRYTNTPHLIKCSIVSCDIGVSNTVDGFFTATEIANCRTAGLRMQAGANSNTFIGGRIEWTSNGQNVIFSGATGSLVSGWMFSGTLFDRGSNGNIQLSYCSRITFSGCLFHRGNRSASTALQDNCNVYLANSRDVVFVGNVISRGQDDNNTGNDSPEYGFAFGTGNGSISIAGGSFVTAGTPFVSPLRNVTNNTEFKMLSCTGAPDRVIAPDGTQVDSNSKRYRSVFSGSVAASATTISALSTRINLSSFSTAVIEVEAYYRNSSTGAAASARFSLQLTRGTTTSVAGTSTAFATIGGSNDIGFGTGTAVDLAITGISDTGDSITLSVTNKLAAPLNVTLRLI